MSGGKRLEFRRKQPHPGPADNYDVIEADAIIVEVVDKHTGRTFRRSLPVRYHETVNGVLLEGETITGEPARIGLFSTAALAKLNELVGKGPDVPRCEGPKNE